MTEKEQIKAEIEGRIALAEKCAEAACEKNLHSALEANEMLTRQYKSLLAFINSLPEEKPSEDLEEAAEKFAHFYDHGTCDGIAQDCFIAGAEWQAEKCDEETSKLLYAERQTAYINGWDDHKEQMMKEAVGGTVICYNDDTYAVVSCCCDNKEHHHHSGDKVRIIIVKED